MEKFCDVARENNVRDFQKIFFGERVSFLFVYIRSFLLIFFMHVIKNKLYGFSFNVEIIWAVVFRKEIKLCSCSGFTHVWVV